MIRAKDRDQHSPRIRSQGGVSPEVAGWMTHMFGQPFPVRGAWLFLRLRFQPFGCSRPVPGSTGAGSLFALCDLTGTETRTSPISPWLRRIVS